MIVMSRGDAIIYCYKPHKVKTIMITLDRTTPPLHIKDRNLNIQMDAGHFLRLAVPYIINDWYKILLLSL